MKKKFQAPEYFLGLKALLLAAILTAIALLLDSVWREDKIDVVRGTLAVACGFYLWFKAGLWYEQMEDRWHNSQDFH